MVMEHLYSFFLIELKKFQKLQIVRKKKKSLYNWCLFEWTKLNHAKNN